MPSRMARWLTLNDALAHIRDAQNCTSVEAQRQLKAKIGALIIPVKWADPEGEDKPDPRYLQGTKFKLSGPGFGHDKHEYRQLMVLRSAVIAVWQRGKSKAEPSKEVKSSKRGARRNKHEDDRLRWMTLVEAEEHIEVVQNCDSVEALQQLKTEIGDGVVAVKWADGPMDNPDVTILKTSEFILTGPGFAPDGKEYRPLLIFRADILRLWPEPVERMPGEQSNSKPGPGRPSERDQIWTTLSEMQRTRSLPLTLNRSQKKILEGLAKKLNFTIGSRGWSERTVLQHISDWQKENDPASQKMRK